MRVERWGKMQRERSYGQESKYCCPSHLPLQSPAPKGQLGSSNDWQLDPIELASKFTPRTKILVLNTPNNPLGKVLGIHSEILQGKVLGVHSEILLGKVQGSIQRAWKQTLPQLQCSGLISCHSA